MQARPDKSLILDPNEFYILASKEAVQVPPDYAADGGRSIRWSASSACTTPASSILASATLGAGGKGARAVLEVRSREVPFILRARPDRRALVYEKMIARPDKL